MARGPLSRPRPGARRAAAALVAAIVAVGGGACSRPADQLDPTTASEQIAAAVTSELAISVDEVGCPDDLPLGEGEGFDCDVELADGAGTLPVTVAQVDDEGTLQVVPGAVVRSDAELADDLRAALRDAFDRSFQVDCGDGPAVVRAPGSELTCRARDASSRRSVTVTVTDERGSLRFELSEP